ncbi:2-C-methyl-D-erythritol 2,4-cyclodiphosphate synthase [Actinomyces sp. 2119]|uniref:2-C-methyl-D-erythritol 2,4-cyclodiphosphate synthase n=1 Tax=Actinomyces lilanjuaniae TaxID=2321394 RepID=A0ABN5PT86_9ACTO|nr:MULTISPECIES: 2-C-methyl-D-erythritol 2,4-cyclodiphosphate synthase [Actinomyces]AYD90467.1 2-C-methyl-D-erythritol 2,4-cyclodiphosphate synthase [Actinomyces lilanjuaniae]RJF40380.1 2-C-methyl-D-erythritol 2,4-cyclodiphosphate synthase [Actinomyces sp. 2119]
MPGTSLPEPLPDAAQPAAPPLRRTPRHATGPATIDLDQVVHYLPRTGIGTDVHAFAAPGSATPLHLACLEWPGQTGLEGHSDGDVVAHACCDALLSATGLGDLGSVFGTNEPRWQGASGAVLLAETAQRVRQAGFEIGNVAVQLVGQRPRVTDRAAEAAAALSTAASARVTFSATTTDHLGFLGREEGLAAVATALVYPARPVS